MMKKQNNRRNVIRGAMTMALAVAAFGVGCADLYPEVDQPFDPSQPIDCNDLRISGMTIDEDPDSPFAGDGIVYANTAFGIQWFTEFVRGTNQNYFGFTGDYIARLYVIQDGMEVYTQDMDATPINVASGDWDLMVVEAGLPAGTYTLRVGLDPQGAVEQCTDLIFLLNDTTDLEFVVEPTPIDDVVNDAGGESPNTFPRG